ncbi:unnamed protein product [Paramecium octaurelia]|uniref:Uncharacterized protein n=1 Tax=Paramecium octaurelia TaxID=43137 RepID=A0A8S1XT37_PAROT|nr:unnamed protein product [Paramecium octaurelia]
MINQQNVNLQSNVKIQSILGFIPALVFQHILENQIKGIKQHVPEIQSFKSVIMFADICGFTNLTEQLSKIGPEGSEVIAFAINRYMELLIKSISKSGGDIFKFAGDAIIVVWPPPTGSNDKDEQLKVLLRQGIQSALDIQAKLNDTFILENIKLSVKIGFGVGDINILYVGGVFNRNEFLATGQALIQAFESEHCATKGGQVIISKDVFDMVGQYYNCLKVEDRQSYFVNFNKGAKVQNISNALLIKSNISAQSFESIKSQLIRYIPAALQQYIYVDQEKWSSELRILTIMFINLSIDLSAALTSNGLSHIQQVVEAVQKSIYAFQGSLNKILMDDKGSTLIVVFGLPPMAKQDDPARAVMTAITMKQELDAINCGCKIGISTGCTFAGVVGTSGSRREYSVIGDAVNLAARLMQIACKDDQHSILLDVETSKEASYKMNISFYKSVMVKGKADQVNIYYPEVNLELNKIRIHNPFFPRLLDNYLFDISNLRQIQRRIQQFQLQNESNVLLKISGNQGSGKSYSVKQSIDLFQENFNFVQIRLCSFLQKEQQYLYAIKIIFQHFLKQIAIKQNKAYDIQLFNEIFNQQYDQLIQLFDFQPISQIELFDKQFKNNNNSQEILDIQLVKEGIDVLFKKFQSITNHHKQIFVLDDGHNIDEDTLKIIRHFMKHNQFILLIFIFRHDYFEQFQFQEQHQTQIQMIEDGLESITSKLNDISNFEHISFNNISLYDYQVLLADLFRINKIRCSKNQESSNSIDKNILHYEYIKNQLIQSNTQEFFLQTIYRKTQGNPLTFITLIEKLLRCNYLVADNQQQDVVIVNDSLLNILNLDEFIILEAPLNKFRLNSPYLDKVGCLDLLILKVASIIGDIFDVQTLNKIQPFKEVIQKENLIKILNSLEELEIIETMELNDLNKYYRFAKPFLREIIYQRLLFSQRRELHKYYAQALQEIPSQFEIDEKLEAQRLEHTWILAEQKWNSQSNLKPRGLELSHKAKRSIIIKSIQTKLIAKTNNIKLGLLKKKSDKNVTWAERYCLMTQKELKYYYSEQDYHRQPQNALATIMLSSIYQIVPLNDKEKVNQKYAFEIRTGNWFKRQKLMPRRDFYFSASSEELMEEWTIYIEFMRVKATYDEFVNNFGKIQFPIANFKEFYDMSLGTEMNNYQQKQIKNKNNKSSIIQPQKRNTVLSINSFFKQSVVENKQKQNKEELKLLISKFLKQSQLLLFTHMFENSIQTKNRIILGQNTKAMLSFGQFFIKTVSEYSQQQQQENETIQTEESPQTRPRASLFISEQLMLEKQAESISGSIRNTKRKQTTDQYYNKRSKSSELLVQLNENSNLEQQQQS